MVFSREQPINDPLPLHLLMLGIWSRFQTCNSSVVQENSGWSILWQICHRWCMGLRRSEVHCYSQLLPLNVSYCACASMQRSLPSLTGCGMGVACTINKSIVSPLLFGLHQDERTTPIYSIFYKSQVRLCLQCIKYSCLWSPWKHSLIDVADPLSLTRLMWFVLHHPFWARD